MNLGRRPTCRSGIGLRVFVVRPKSNGGKASDGKFKGDGRARVGDGFRWFSGVRRSGFTYIVHGESQAVPVMSDVSYPCLDVQAENKMQKLKMHKLKNLKWLNMRNRVKF